MRYIIRSADGLEPLGKQKKKKKLCVHTHTLVLSSIYRKVRVHIDMYNIIYNVGNPRHIITTKRGKNWKKCSAGGKRSATMDPRKKCHIVAPLDPHKLPHPHPLNNRLRRSLGGVQ